jgi:hypothetical protein
MLESDPMIMLSSVWLLIAAVFGMNGNLVTAAFIAAWWFPHHRWESQKSSRPASTLPARPSVAESANSPRLNPRLPA